VGGRCVNPYDPAADYPEHREDEARERDPLFERHPDDFGVHPLAPLDRQLFEDCRKVQGKVVGRHDASVATPWYLTAEFVAKRLHCSARDAAQLADAWAILDADEPMVERFLAMSRGKLPQALAYFTTLATGAAEAEAVDPDDALHHPSDGLVHPFPGASPGYALSPEMLLLVREGVPSAALIAHQLHVSLAQAGDIREAVALQAFGEAVRRLPSPERSEGSGLTADEEIAADQAPDVELEDAEDPLEAVSADLEEHLHQLEAVEVGTLGLEGWHLLDEPDEEPTWLERQPARYQVLLHQVEAADDLDQLKRLGQKGYAATWFTREQRQVFWSSWAVRKGALLEQVARRQLRREVARIQAASDLTRLGQRLYQVQHCQPQRYSPAQWAALWYVYHRRKTRPLVH
jgi:hypothetical protein